MLSIVCVKMLQLSFECLLSVGLQAKEHREGVRSEDPQQVEDAQKTSGGCDGAWQVGVMGRGRWV